MTMLAVLVHPEGRDGERTVMTPQRERELLIMLMRLRFFADRKKISIMASPATTAERHTEIAAQFYNVEPFICESLLRHATRKNAKETCSCIEEFLDPNVGLLIVIVSLGLSGRVVDLIARHAAKKNKDKSRKIELEGFFVLTPKAA